VDDATQILKTLSLKSYESEYTVIIVWMVEKLFHAAAPKLLKILEEPPDKTLFILVTENHDQILNTIISRTQLVKLYAHPDEEMKLYIERFFHITGERLNQIVNHSEGSFKKVYELIDLSEKDDFNYTHFREMMLFSYNNNFLKMKEKVAAISDIGRERTKQLLKYGLHITRLCLLYDLGNNELIRSEGQEYDFISKFSKFVNSKNAEQIMEILTDGIFHVERNGNVKIILLDIMLKSSLVLKK
jgi:DNA polymerase-3 subunit delta'